MELLVFLGLIGMQLVVVTSEILPPPELSLVTSGTMYMGQNVELQCTAPKDYPEGTFYLILNNTGQNLQRKDAAETKNSVTFTVETSYTLQSLEYVCIYQLFVEDERQTSEASNVLSLTLNVPVWALVLAALLGLLIVVALVLVPICLVRKNKRKKQEQRDKESIWIDQSFTTDLSDGKDNMVFSLKFTSTTDISQTYMGPVDSETDNGSATPFSTFRI